jgi:hypothetical protein
VDKAIRFVYRPAELPFRQELLSWTRAKTVHALNRAATVTGHIPAGRVLQVSNTSLGGTVSSVSTALFRRLSELETVPHYSQKSYVLYQDAQYTEFHAV